VPYLQNNQKFHTQDNITVKQQYVMETLALAGSKHWFQKKRCKFWCNSPHEQIYSQWRVVDEFLGLWWSLAMASDETRHGELHSIFEKTTLFIAICYFSTSNAHRLFPMIERWKENQTFGSSNTETHLLENFYKKGFNTTMGLTPKPNQQFGFVSVLSLLIAFEISSNEVSMNYHRSLFHPLP